jgi:hypothetical protein
MDKSPDSIIVIVKLPALKGGASRKGNYLFQIASLNPALKGGACREANRSKIISS